ncbi:MAG: pilus assembly protein TadG-related protein [Planctomycetota bacterium]
MSRAFRRVRPTDRAGVVLIAALLALVLLASAVFFVFNVGTHIHRKIETQHAADAAAIAGAGWVARTMNLVAMNNVESARLMAQVQIYDGIPAAIRSSQRDAEAALTGIANQLDLGLTGHPWVLSALREVEVDLTRQAVLLSQLNDALNIDYEIAEMTHYELGDGSKGSMWETIEALGQISQTALNEMGFTAQIAAYHAGRQNLSEADGRAFLVPIVPTIPWQRGEPEDFIRPITDGLLPEDQDDEQWARGPFDALFGFRVPTLTGSEFVMPPYNVVQDYGVVTFRDEAPPLARGDVRDYEVQSIFDFFLQQIRDAESAALDSEFNEDGSGSYFAERATDAALQNKEQLDRQLIGGAGPRTLIDVPAWNHDHDEYDELLNSRDEVPESMFIRLVFEAEAVDGQGNPLDGTLALESWALYPGVPPEMQIRRRGREEWPRMQSIDGSDDRVFRDTRVLSYETDTGFSDLRTQYTYLVWCAFHETEETVRRFPNNFSSAADDLPAPFNLNLDELPHDYRENVPAPRRYLSVFAAADQSATARVWPSLFDGGGEEAVSGRPWKRAVATASAEVFNNHSWDLWTQMWHAQLTPVGDLQGWLTFAFDEQQGEGEDEIVEGQGFRSTEFEGLVGIPQDWSQQIGETFRYLRDVEKLMAAMQQPRAPRGRLIGENE